jgi:hypothetical protein
LSNAPFKASGFAAAALSLLPLTARVQSAELAEVRLLSAPDAPAQSAVFEVVNESDHEISSLAVSCHLLNDAGKAIAVKVLRQDVTGAPPSSGWSSY